MKTTFFKGKLATKVFALFIIASFLPLLLGESISYYHVQKIIRESVAKQLQDTAKEYGLSLFYRLKLAKDTLENNADKLLIEDEISLAQSHLSDYFSAIAVHQKEDNAYRPVWGEISDKVYSIEKIIDSNIVSITKTNQRNDIYIILKKGIYGKIDSEFLWDINTTNPDIDLCITNHQFDKLFCDIALSTHQLKQAINKTTASTQRHFRWQLNSQGISSTYWSLFLDHEFNIENWIIIASQNEDFGQSQLSSYRQLFFPLMLFSLLLVVFLSLVIIRKNTAVINKLISGTRKIIDSDFDSKIDIDTNDEFFELANSFNTMAHSLKSVASEYRALSKVDQAILASTADDNIIASIFTSLYVIAPFNTLILINQHAQNNKLSRYYHQAHPQASIQSNNNTLLNTYELNMLKQTAVSTVAAQSLALPTLQQLWPLSDPYVCIIPIIDENKCCSILLGTLPDNQLNSLKITKINNVSQRIVVAFQALAREATLRYQANFDPLTGIPNRHKMISLCNLSYASEGQTPRWVAFLFLDLDRFKHVNDNYGHMVGDQLLKQFAQLMQNLLARGELIARLGGDEFAIALYANNKSSLHQRITALADNIIATANQPFTIAHHVLHIGASIGVFITPEHGESFEESLRYADIAMYFSKKNGGNSYTIYEEGMSESLLKRTLLERDLRLALDNNEIEVHYQPKVHAITRDIVGFEALFRWNHPTYGAISPLDAVQMAEDIGLIGQLGKLVFTLSIQQWQQWLSLGYRIGIISINVSPAQLIQPGFIEFIERTLAETPLVKPEQVELEITESVMFEEKEDALNTLQEVRDIGLGIAIDDFGTGYSSLSYLLDIPANILKIDRAFVIKIEQDDNALALLSSLISLGKSMGYEIVAEGIETEHQAAFLADCNTDQLQGYLFSKPLPAHMIEHRFLQRTP